MEFVGKVEEYGMKLEEKVQEKKNEKIKQDSVLSVGVALGKLRKNKSVDVVSIKFFTARVRQHNGLSHKGNKHFTSMD